MRGSFNRKRKYRFDSPPKGDDALLGEGKGVASTLQDAQAQTSVQTAKIDRKLYVGNLPTGINSAMVFWLDHKISWWSC